MILAQSHNKGLIRNKAETVFTRDRAKNSALPNSSIVPIGQNHARSEPANLILMAQNGPKWFVDAPQTSSTPGWNGHPERHLATCKFENSKRWDFNNLKWMDWLVARRTRFDLNTTTRQYSYLNLPSHLFSHNDSQCMKAQRLQKLAFFLPSEAIERAKQHEETSWGDDTANSRPGHLVGSILNHKVWIPAPVSTCW